LLRVCADWESYASVSLDDDVKSLLAAAAARERGGAAPGTSLADAALVGESPDPGPLTVAAVDALPARHRAVLVSRYIDALDDAQTQRRLGVTNVSQYDKGVLSARTLVAALRAHEDSVTEPLDPVSWLKDEQRRCRRRQWRLTAVAAAVALVIVACVGFVRHDRSAQPSVVMTLPPAGHSLLRWAPFGNLVGDTQLVRRAARAWEDQAPPAAAPAGPVYVLLAQTFARTPVIVLQGLDASGGARLALVSGSAPHLVSTDVVAASAAPLALRIPVVFATGGSAVFADDLTDALLLGPHVESWAWRGAVGWQRTVQAVSQGGPVVASDAQSRWRLLRPIVRRSRIVVLARSTVGQVEIDRAERGGTTTPIVWRLPDEGSAALVLHPDATQVLVTGQARRWPGWYRRTALWWQGLGRSGDFRARVLPPVTRRSGIRFLSMQLSTPSRRRAMVVSAGMRAGARVCYSAAPLPRGGVDRYPFVVAACRVPGGGNRPRVLLHGFGSRQDRAVTVVAQGVAPDGRLIGPALRTRVRHLEHGVWMRGVPARASGVVVTAADHWNTLPAFAWTAPLSRVGSRSERAR